MTKKMKVAVLSAVAVVVAIALTVILTLCLRITAQTEIAVVNGDSISAGEWKLAADREKASTITHFTELGANTATPDFWDTAVSGTSPNEYLRQTALNDAVRYKLQLRLGADYGLIDDISYDGFIAEMEKTNADNKAKIAAGEPVAGQKAYTLSTYYSYRLSNLKLDLQKKMGEKGQPLYADKNTLKAFFDKVKDEYYKKADTCEFAVLKSDKSDANAVKSAADLINGRAFDFNSLCAEVTKKQSGISVVKVAFDDNSASALSKQNPSLFETAQSLKVGMSAVYNNNGVPEAVYCISRKSAGYKDFNSVFDALTAQYREVKYEEYVDNLVKNAKIEKKSVFSRLDIDTNF